MRCLGLLIFGCLWLRPLVDGYGFNESDGYQISGQLDGM